MKNSFRYLSFPYLRNYSVRYTKITFDITLVRREKKNMKKYVIPTSIDM